MSISFTSATTEHVLSGTAAKKHNMRKRKRQVRRGSIWASIVSVAAFQLTTAGMASASGLETSGIGARGRAMGYALTAVADDWSALYYNPAGLATLSSGEFACVYEYFVGETSSSSSLRNVGINEAPDPARGDFIDFVGDEPSAFGEKKVRAVVHAGEMGWTGRSGDWGYGFGLFGSGAGTAWEDEVPVSGSGRLEGEVSFSNISVNLPLGVAWSPRRGLSLGGVFTARVGRLDVLYRKERKGAFPYEMETEQKTSGYGAGVDVGFLWTPSPRWSLGGVWRLPALTVRKGKTTAVNTLSGLSVSSDTTVEERIPSRATLGISLRPGRDSILALSLTWMNWSAYERTTEYDEVVSGALEDNSGNPAEWGDTFVVNLGGEVRLSGQWFLRGGIVWDQAPEPSEYRTLVGGQTIDVWKFTVGGGKKSDKGSFDFGYTLTWGEEEEGYVDGARYEVLLNEFYVGYVWRI